MIEDSLNKYNELKKKYDELKENYESLQEACGFLLICLVADKPPSHPNYGNEGHYDVCRCASNLSYDLYYRDSQQCQNIRSKELSEMQIINTQGPEQCPWSDCSHQNLGI